MPTFKDFQPDVATDTATIASSNTTSGVINLAGATLTGLIFPGTMTGTSMTFQMSDSETGTFVPVQNGGTGVALSVTIAASKYVPVDPTDFAGVQFLKLVSGSTEVAQRDITVVGKNI